MWWAHCQDLGKIGLKTVTGQLVRRRERRRESAGISAYFGGIPAYFKKCEEVVENGYEGFSFG